MAWWPQCWDEARSGAKLSKWSKIWQAPSDLEKPVDVEGFFLGSLVDVGWLLTLFDDFCCFLCGFRTDGRWIFVDFGGGWGLLEDEDSWCISFPVVAPGGDVPLNLKTFSAVLSGCGQAREWQAGSVGRHAATWQTDEVVSVWWDSCWHWACLMVLDLIVAYCCVSALVKQPHGEPLFPRADFVEQPPTLSVDCYVGTPWLDNSIKGIQDTKSHTICSDFSFDC